MQVASGKVVTAGRLVDGGGRHAGAQVGVVSVVVVGVVVQVVVCHRVVEEVRAEDEGSVRQLAGATSLAALSRSAASGPSGSRRRTARAFARINAIDTRIR